jgi:hypothetical protein
LLQNADDNLYKRAIARGDVPYVSFRVYPRRIIVECNEDGFTNENLRAICSVGKSSKTTGAQGYIGEKGIGFKSVFMVAWKVHIESGPFSFSFRHRDGQSGMGMISPIWEDNGELIMDGTRITLHLRDDGDSKLQESRYRAIREQLEELQGSILLFLQNLKQVEVRFYDEMGVESSTATYSIDRPDPHRASLKTTKGQVGQTMQQAVQRYHVTKQQVTNLARRSSTNSGKTGGAHESSQVILAFPISETSVPVVEPQEVFAFLPVRPVGFNFLIQADFETNANRQDIVKDSIRNNNLIDGIADTFIKAVLQFCEHDTLRYQWMRYLPNKNSPNWDRFWLSLVNKIADRLSNTCVLYGRRRPDLRLIKDLVRLTPDAVDEHGEPLFDDGEPELIVSQSYLAADLAILQNHGLRNVSFTQIIRWLRRDLQLGFLTRMKSSNTSHDWHARTARLLHSCFTRNLDFEIQELRNTNLLPLEGYTWVSASSGPVYFPEVDGISIPSDINLRIISKEVTHEDRRTLFKDLGVKSASVALVREKIHQRYLDSDLQLPISSSKDHLRFLYLSEASKSDTEPSYMTYGLSIYDTKGSLYKPCLRDMYVVDDTTYGAWEVLRKTNLGPNHGDGAPGYSAALFVNQKYFINIPETTADQKTPWREWFINNLAVRRYVRLWCKSPDDATEYVQRYRLDKYLRCLLLSYRAYGFSSTTIIPEIRRSMVLCRDGNERAMEETYFPTTELVGRAERFLEPGSSFPWLLIDTKTTHDAIPADWKTLFTLLGVGIPATDLDFALSMLRYSKASLAETLPSASRVRLFSLYEYIQAKYREHDEPIQARDKIM